MMTSDMKEPKNSVKTPPPSKEEVTYEIIILPLTVCMGNV